MTPAPAAAGIGPMGVIMGALSAAGKLLDPAVVVGLSPHSALQVTPVTFQSVEQEGRWKPASLVAALGRAFELQNHAESSSPPSKPRLAEPYGTVTQYWCPLFSLDMPSIGATLGTSEARSTLRVDAIWWGDGLEIYGGYAGLGRAQGFGSIWDTMASTSLQATPFGNYYPATTLLTWSGWVNPIGSAYWEFRGALLVRADGTNNGKDQPVPQYSGQVMAQKPPVYMDVWGRQPDETKQANGWNLTSGFLLKDDEIAA
jgi:hypothetical protein